MQATYKWSCVIGNVPSLNCPSGMCQSQGQRSEPVRNPVAGVWGKAQYRGSGSPDPRRSKWGIQSRLSRVLFNFSCCPQGVEQAGLGPHWGHEHVESGRGKGTLVWGRSSRTRTPRPTATVLRGHNANTCDHGCNRTLQTRGDANQETASNVLRLIPTHFQRPCVLRRC